MSLRSLFYVTGMALGLNAAPAAACGYCVEDKMAAVYEHTMVTQALERNHHVAFFAITGNLVPGDGTRRALEIIAESITGVDKGSARASIESASLALAFDPQHSTLRAMQKTMEQKLAVKKLSLQPLQVIEQGGKMRVLNENDENK